MGESPITDISEALATKGKVITCRAAVAWSPGTPLTIENVEVECPQKMEVRVKILYTSICHTDLTSWLGENEAQRAYPRIFGHEASGVVESVGEGVEDLKEGDHVIPVFNGECGSCAYCQSDKTNQCEKYRVNPMKSTMFGDGKTRISIKGQPVYHFLNTSTFVEYTVLDAGCLVKIDPSAALDKMSLLSCGVTTGVGAVWNDANVKEGETVAVFGLGAIGLAAIQGAKIRGASRIIGIDINQDKIDLGREMGMTDFVNPKELDKPVHEVINGMVKGGVDYSFECVGNLDVLRQAFLSTRDGWGVTVMIGIHTSPRFLPFHPMELFSGRKMVGSVFGGVKCKTHIPSIVKKCVNGTLKLDAFITHELPFDEINKAFKLLEEGKSLRCLLHF
ncbi:Alcohol dehydrogenase 2, putative, expressed [Zostera marina]|uniref:Alcohol dehydrogenase 2, putative, expressed n=1 Tax=Zostera marina TaxID=29655 RepID=A0A0K9PYL2_ZOSMR|nr:Alcohol dehydrogenase 2, putative, expressed [Zostera marina]